MLWLAEKAAELAVTSWTPVLYARSRSVSPRGESLRGEGPAFADKVRRRMIAALEQSAGAWLPVIERDVEPGEAAGRFGDCVRLLLDATGDAVLSALAAANDAGVAIALGPEGGFEAAEVNAFRDVGWRPAALAPTVLRFETAAVAAAAVARAALMSREPLRP
jgi:16S rRNA (uracil1498-N3)-methyltransferase